WTAGGTETSWNIELVDVTAGGTVTGTATATGVTNPYSLTGLTAGNDYEYYVQADCGGDTSAWAGPFSFTTLCNPITSYPWSEDFESVSTPDLPNCWSYINNNGDTDYWRTYTTYGVGGSTTAGLYTDFNSGNNDDYLVLPQFTLTGNERLKFSVRARSSSEPNDYRVVLSTLGSTPTDFTEELLPLTQVSSTTQTEITPIDLSGYTGDVFIAIHVPSGGLDGYYIYFDEFVVEPIPSCIQPGALTASNVTSSSADLSWTAGGTETSWNIELVDVTAGGTVT
uniref:choice-of-anchor J domain-containing protein n=1 Tax=Mesoflavibacter sp. CH_XMU1404-2 TaxID=3107766 RepID=UPI003007FBEC